MVTIRSSLHHSDMRLEYIDRFSNTSRKGGWGWAWRRLTLGTRQHPYKSTHLKNLLKVFWTIVLLEEHKSHLKPQKEKEIRRHFMVQQSQSETIPKRTQKCVSWSRVTVYKYTHKLFPCCARSGVGQNMSLCSGWFCISFPFIVRGYT